MFKDIKLSPFKVLIGLMVAGILVSGCKRQDSVDYVNHFIGTGEHGHTFPGPDLPNQSDLKVDYNVTAANYLVKQYPSTFANLEYAREAISMEMRLEIAMEGLRHFDLVRWGIAASTINVYLDQERSFRSLFTGVSPAVFTSKRNEYWPIPQNQIDLQPGILKQNVGY
jgi:hypothetical protein